MQTSLFERAAPATTSRVLARTVLQLLAVCLVVAVAWYDVRFLSPRSSWHGFFDLRVYRGAAQWWLDGRPLYEFHLGRSRYGFTYPPFALLLVLPTAWVPLAAAAAISLAGSVLLVVAITAWLVLPVSRRHGGAGWFAVALAVPVVLAMEPIRETLGYGQVNMLVFGLVVADVVALRRGSAWAGVGIGLAAALKLTPVLFVVYLLLVRRLRAAATAAATFLGAAVVGLLVDRRASWQYWTVALWDTSRVGSVPRSANQSLLGVLARAADTETPDRRLWAVVAGAVLVLALWRAVRAARAGDEVVGMTLIGLATCLISPIAWTHHLYWMVPAAVVLVDVAAGTPVSRGSRHGLRDRSRPVAVAAAAGALVVVAPLALSVMWIGVGWTNRYRDGLGGLLLDDVYAAIVLALVVLLPVRELTGSGAPCAPRSRGRPRPGG